MSRVQVHLSSVRFLVGLIVAGVIIYTLWLDFDLNFASGQITDYTLMCSQELVRNECTVSWIQGPRTIFTVFKDQQVVVAQPVNLLPQRLAQCAVVDRKNWSCTEEGGKDLMGFADGRYLGTSILREPWKRHVGRPEWMKAPDH